MTGYLKDSQLLFKRDPRRGGGSGRNGAGQLGNGTVGREFTINVGDNKGIILLYYSFKAKKREQTRKSMFLLIKLLANPKQFGYGECAD